MSAGVARLATLRGSHPVSLPHPASPLRPTGLLRAAPSPADLHLFTWHLETLLAAGIPLPHGLAVVGEGFEDPAMRRLVREIRAAVAAGLPLSVALARHPACFPETFRALVQAGEATGLLGEMLSLAARFQEGSCRLRSFFDAWLIARPGWWAALWGTFSLAGLAMVDGLTPEWMEEATTTPWTVSAVTALVMLPTVLMVVYLVSQSVAAVLWREGEAGGPLLDWIAVRIPLVGEWYGNHLLGRALLVMHHLLAAGVPMTQALEAAAASTPHCQWRSALRGAAVRVRGGEPLALALDVTAPLPEQARLLIASGEENGDLAPQLAWLGGFYEQEVTRRTALLATAILPLNRFLHLLVLGSALLAVLQPFLSIPMF
ncbi:MAG: hypothetical protein GX442_06425 [Candidatus Riflebacteria bacterium]|nr:hypothetical protein [Candidatus Riflebacteria bacterium]